MNSQVFLIGFPVVYFILGAVLFRWFRKREKNSHSKEIENMVISSFRVNTVTALFFGLSAGVFLGAIGAQQIAKNWPHSQNLFQPIKNVTAPSPLTFGKSANGEIVLCDKNNFAYTLVNYENGEVHRAWIGFQELQPVLKIQSVPPVDDAATKPIEELQEKCL